jgi:hypothetical protein
VVIPVSAPTDEELARWRAVAEREVDGPWPTGHPLAYLVRTAIPALLDEVERLRTLLAGEKGPESPS